MRKIGKAIVAMALVAVTAVPATAETTVVADTKQAQITAWAVHFDPQPFCRDVCEPAPKKLAGSGAFVAR